ncbi:MAG TPA: mercury methylation ferredoxin HgcB [Syntrophorhabdus sp.]|jgi:NAD-dependent dihydropyrimidine dehydrogenase PreA subunit|nr:4Fe-4S binding protein [Syntrophorhabdus sp.]MDI9558183.1 mercury methylation ferredoxin HgcB [Pseudomonadota bacterium]OPX93243.1 MAG: 4Fe-4S binding domain protein [Syntrophorhabdus sp. PtaB.Bin027]OQB76115.1 MAG: 4Fe-4S binding domain protein [Deltaproteobacteria bacterium ADurb.Bin135]HOD77752.1 mercury methylation ferredoxin HgcB [Syntrophorhabdus sp.]
MFYIKNVVTLIHEQEMCNSCGICLTVCPRRVFQRSNRVVEIARRDACIECGACQRNCSQGAVTVRAGVGCASALINRMLGRKKACCVVDNG